jgi:hypothetical protein
MHDVPAIPALLPRGPGHQFVCYADACSGVPGAPHEETFAAINRVVSRLDPAPEFICFPGDEVQGLTADRDELRRQWQFWFDREMAWLDRESVPLFHTTGNHTTYDAASEAVFREVLSDLPRNGPPEQIGLAYFVRRSDLLLIFVNTCWSGSGEGRVETAWLERVLTDHADVRSKLVIGHHPVFAVNGFSGPMQRDIWPEDGRPFWEILVRHGVLAYLCSHVLAFDVQVHDGVLQILTAGAGTAHRMPEDVEYLHCVQLAIDAFGLRYQVLDRHGQIREWLSWPPAIPAAARWSPLPRGVSAGTPEQLQTVATNTKPFLAWRLRGQSAADGRGEAQTLLSGWDDGPGLAPLWIGLLGPEQRLCVLLAPTPGRSPHLWYGPTLAAGTTFDLQLAAHAGMGPGGFLWRVGDDEPWTSLTAASPWGPERMSWRGLWSVGHGKSGPDDRPFRGHQLQASVFATLVRR